MEDSTKDNIDSISENQKEPLCYSVNLDTGERKVFPVSKYKEIVGYDLNEMSDVEFTVEPIIDDQGKSIGSKIVIPLS